MLNIVSIIFILTAMLLSSTAQAHLQFGKIIHAGTGCKHGDEPRLSLKNSTLRIAFANLRVAGQAERALERSTCQVRIPVVLEPGYRLKVSAAELSGRVRAPSPAEVVLRSDIGLVGEDGRVLSNRYAGVAKTRSIRQTLNFIEEMYSGCGGESILRLNNEARLQKPESFASSVTGQVRSVSLRFEIEKCD